MGTSFATKESEHFHLGSGYPDGWGTEAAGDMRKPDGVCRIIIEQDARPIGGSRADHRLFGGASGAGAILLEGGGLYDGYWDVMLVEFEEKHSTKLSDVICSVHASETWSFDCAMVRLVRP
jgi:hypothetical protein